MNILIITQHFPPEKGAVRRLFEFSRYFVSQGHQVSVLTAIPNYPDGIVPEKYRGHFFYTEEMDGVKVYRSYVLPAANRYPGKRMVGFLTFLVTAVLNSFRLKDNFDVIIASSPPVTTPVIGWLISRLKRKKLVVEIRDPQPECSEEFGALKPSLFTRFIKRVVHFVYHRADMVVAVSEGFTEFVLKIGVPPARVSTVKSGVGGEFFDAGTNGIRKKFGWEEKFLVLYAGTMGWAHSFEVVIEAARKLTDQPDIAFVFVGDGEKRGVLEDMVRDYGLKNVSFVGLQPLETIPYFLRASDVLVESLKEVRSADPVTKGTFPAKLYEYMASGRPIIFGSREGNEAVTELSKAGGALSFHTDDPERLAELIMDLKSGRINGESLGEKYREHATRFHRREAWAERYLEQLRGL
jgi:colanic acid biosynthesis glycosyl transferase WcaI